MIGIIFLLDLKYAPYLKNYTNVLESMNLEYEIITWNRLSNDQKPNVYSFYAPLKLETKKSKKLRLFLKYSNFINKRIKQQKYSKLIVLTTITGFLAYKSLRKYKNNFIFDIRDYTYEKNPLFKCFESKIIKMSKFTVISSPGFKEFLPKGNYIISHNFLSEEINPSFSYQSFDPHNKVRIVFLGAVRHFAFDKKMIDFFKNDERFELWFHGNGASFEKTKEYVSISKITNVFLTGEYDRKNKPLLYSGATIINGYYSENEYANLFALSNKFYDSLIYKIPFWGNPKCYCGRKAVENGFGLNVELSENSKEEIINFLINMDCESFNKNCCKELDKVIEENNIFAEQLKDFLDEQ